MAGLLTAMGYHVSWIAPPGPDGGIDIIAHTDPLGTGPVTIKVAVRRRREKAAVDTLRSFMALLAEGDVGLYVSLGGFTRDAEEEARFQERRKIRLLDLQRLFDLWVSHFAKLEERDRSLLPITPIWFLAPEEHVTT